VEPAPREGGPLNPQARAACVHRVPSARCSVALPSVPGKVYVSGGSAALENAPFDILTVNILSGDMEVLVILRNIRVAPSPTTGPQHVGSRRTKTLPNQQNKQRGEIYAQPDRLHSTSIHASSRKNRAGQLGTSMRPILGLRDPSILSVILILLPCRDSDLGHRCLIPARTPNVCIPEGEASPALLLAMPPVR